jgi:hypothetical protein
MREQYLSCQLCPIVKEGAYVSAEV